jgi:DNA-binding LacI/PurR family transcriptional regulator
LNIRDVARRANVSTATVSRVISGKDIVRQETRHEVLRAIKALGYVPDSNARSLSSGRSGLLGLIISDVTNPFFPDLIQTFTELAEKHHLGAIVSHTNYDAARVERSIQRMVEQKVEGLAIMTSELSERPLRQLGRRRIPMVFLDSSETLLSNHLNHVHVDYERGIREAISHLVGLQHKRIAFISGPKDLRSAAWRQNFFLKVLNEHGIKVNRQTLAHGNHRVDGGYAAMKELLKAKHRPTAVLGSNDLTAIGAISAIYQAGLQVPRDISIIGFDDIEISSAYNPPLTTVRLSRVDVATRAFEILASAINHTRSKVQTTPVTTNLVVRSSTGIAKSRRWL